MPAKPRVEKNKPAAVSRPTKVDKLIHESKFSTSLELDSHEKSIMNKASPGRPSKEKVAEKQKENAKSRKAKEEQKFLDSLIEVYDGDELVGIFTPQEYEVYLSTL